MAAPTLGVFPGEHAASMTLRTIDDLRAAQQSGGMRNRPVVVDLPGLPPDEARAASRRLTQLLAECGCSEGAKAMVGGAVLALAGTVLVTGGPFLRLLELAPLTLLGAVLGAGAGKTFGLVRSRHRFRRELELLINQHDGTTRGA